jgi:hypothetical protein
MAMSPAVLFAPLGAGGIPVGTGGGGGVAGGLDPPVLGRGDGECVGDGVGVGLSEGLGDGVALGLGEGEGVGEGLSDGLGDGVGEGSAEILIAPSVSVCHPWS